MHQILLYGSHEILIASILILDIQILYLQCLSAFSMSLKPLKKIIRSSRNHLFSLFPQSLTFLLIQYIPLCLIYDFHPILHYIHSRIQHHIYILSLNNQYTFLLMICKKGKILYCFESILNCLIRCSVIFSKF